MEQDFLQYLLFVAILAVRVPQSISPTFNAQIFLRVAYL